MLYKACTAGINIPYNLLKPQIISELINDEKAFGTGYYLGYTERKFGFAIPLVARYPQFRTLESRLKSFEDWSPDVVSELTPFAEAGFCFLGQKPSLICFARGCPLREWTIDTDPWIAHIKLNQGCPVIRRSKGEDFFQAKFRESYIKYFLNYPKPYPFDTYVG